MRENNTVITKVDGFVPFGVMSHTLVGDPCSILMSNTWSKTYTSVYINGLANKDNDHIFMYCPLHHIPSLILLIRSQTSQELI